MIDFLKKYGINDAVIKEMEKVNSDANLYNFSCNQDEAIKIIQYLRDIHVSCIEQLLIYRIDKFFISCDDFKKMYIKQNVENFVKLINEDYTLIDEL